MYIRWRAINKYNIKNTTRTASRAASDLRNGANLIVAVLTMSLLQVLLFITAVAENDKVI